MYNDSSKLNDKIEYRSCTMRSFQKSFSFECSILMDMPMSGGTENVFVPYLRDLVDVIFQRDSTRLHAAHRILIYLDTEDVRPLS
ncbi:hypothetical protein TNCV_4281641 [Trichonephila clavipes]|nr:hypothetical protein TNCV_4281641 [Trichonephila clavipes]